MQVSPRDAFKRKRLNILVFKGKKMSKIGKINNTCVWINFLKDEDNSLTKPAGREKINSGTL